MLSSITPLGERGRRGRWVVAATAYVLGSAVGGALLGTLAGWLGGLLLGPVPGAVALGALALLAGAGALFDTRRLRHRLPTVHRQVNEDWLDLYRDWVYGAGFGAQLGTGVVTIVTTASVYLVWFAALLSQQAWAGALLGLAFGTARALPILRTRRVHDPGALARLFRDLTAGEGRARRVTITAQALAGAAAAVVVLCTV